MRKVLTSLAVVAALALASNSYAVPGTVIMGWTACNTTPVTDISITAQQAATANLVCFVTGQSDPTLSYQIWLWYGNSATKTVPDAWRFDASGCEGSSFITINHLAPAVLSKTCPSFQDAGTTPQQSLQIKDCSFSPPTLQYATTLLRVVCANAYPNGGGNIPSAAAKYFLMDAEFNLSFATEGATNPVNGTCGGLENPMCFNLGVASYIINDGSGNEIPFVFHGGPTGDWATAHSSTQGSAPLCQATPAVTKTWGQIKDQYRN